MWKKRNSGNDFCRNMKYLINFALMIDKCNINKNLAYMGVAEAIQCARHKH